MNCAGCHNDRLEESEVSKWTDNIVHLMANKAGRERFINFLLERDLYDSFQIVDVIDKCDRLISKTKAPNPNWSSIKRKDLPNLVKAAEDLDLYENEEEEVRKILEETDEEKICDILTNLKGKSMELLREEHQEFSKYIHKELQKSCKTK